MGGWKRLSGRLAFGLVVVVGIAVACARGTDPGSVGPPAIDAGTGGTPPDPGPVADAGQPDAGQPDAGGLDGGSGGGGGITFGTPGPWPTTNVTYSTKDGLLGGDLGGGVVGTTTDESQNIWVATRGALYVMRAPSPDGKRPADTTFRRYNGTGGKGTAVDVALHLQGNEVTYVDRGLSNGVDGTLRGGADSPGILSIVGGGPNEVFVGYASNHDWLSPDDGTSRDPFRHNGKVDRVRLKDDGSIEVVRFDLVSGNTTGFWHCRYAWRMVYDHFIHQHELYVGTEHGIDKISPDRWFQTTKSWPYRDNLYWMSDHLHPRVCFNEWCTGDEGKDTQMMGDWRGLAIAPDGDLWVGGKWSAGKIVWTDLPAPLIADPDPTCDDRPLAARTGMCPDTTGTTGWHQRFGKDAYSHLFGDPWCGSSGQVKKWVNGTGWVLGPCSPFSGNPPVFMPPAEGDTVNINAVTVATDGVVWWSSFQYGIANFDETKHRFTYFDPSSMGVAGTITDMVALPDGRLAIGSDGGGVTLWDPATHTSKTIRSGSGLLDDSVRHLELDTMVKPPVLHVSTANGAASIRVFP